MVVGPEPRGSMRTLWLPTKALFLTEHILAMCCVVLERREPLDTFFLLGYLPPVSLPLTLPQNRIYYPLVTHLLVIHSSPSYGRAVYPKAPFDAGSIQANSLL